jgi:hypothetical protein
MKIKKNGKVITLSESDLNRIVKRVLKEQEDTQTQQTFNIDSDLGWVGIKKKEGEKANYTFKVLTIEEKENPNSNVDKEWVEINVGLGDLLKFKVYVSPSSINVISFGDDFRKSTDMNIKWESDDFTHICYSSQKDGVTGSCRGRSNQNTKDFETRIIKNIPKTQYFINLQKKLQK